MNNLRDPHRPRPTADAPEPARAADPEARPSSRLPGYFRRSVAERVALLVEQGRLSDDDAALLLSDNATLPREKADHMIENVVGVYGLPIGLGLNFVVNGRDYVVPMVVEEPSIVAAVSHTAKLARRSGGFLAEADPPIMIGQIQVVGCEDPELAQAQILEARAQLLAEANALHPNMVARGGGARDVQVRVLRPDGAIATRYNTHVIVHLLIHTCDAMGANLINTMAEGIAPTIEALTGGRVLLRILSNLADQRVVRASCRLPFADLGWRGYPGEEVARGIAEASAFAEADPYRAATHNKGVMNGIDAVALATGNDWRAIEAGAHAYCALGDGYRPMAVWTVDEDARALVGRLEIPLQVGIVGGPIRLHPTLKVLYKLLDVRTSDELAEVMGAVGLAQNLAALKALATEGIQRGHMTLHARSVAVTAGARGAQIDRVARALIRDGEIKVHRAKDLLRDDVGG